MPERISRRDLLVLAGLGSVALGTVRPSAARAAPAAARPWPGAPRRAAPAADPAERLLVVVELAGGNDGLSMAPPVDVGELLARRPQSAEPDADLLRPVDDVVLHPALGRLAERPLTVVDGLGTPAPDLSHFEMLRRWWTGDADGTAGTATGFLGRLCDALDAGAPATGVSIGSASSPALVAERAGTIGLPDPGWLWWLADDGDQSTAAVVDALDAMARPDAADGDVLAEARRNLGAGLRAGRLVQGLEASGGYPDSGLGSGLALTAGLLAADVGVRIVHVRADGDYDTHEDHRSRHRTLMEDLDAALDAFLADVDERGLADRVLVATTSEFGRRLEENGSGGLDHGAASSALVLGPVAGGRVGEAPSLRRLDDDGNLVATTSMDEYYATLAESWLGVPASDVLGGRPAPIPGVV